MTAADTAEALSARELHAAEIPAANGITNARSLARMYAALIGDVGGVRVFTPETLERACTPQTDGLGSPEPLSLPADPYPLRFAVGYALHRTAEPMLGDGSYGHSARAAEWASPT